MFALLDAFLQIVLRRRGPEDLPDSQFLLHMTLLAYMLAQVPIVAVLYGWTATSLYAILIDTGLLVLCFWLPLTVARRAGRYRRTLTALLGTGALIGLAQAPLVMLSKLATAAGQAPMGATLALLALVIWSVIVQAHIVSRALSSNMGLGVAVALAYFAISYGVTGQLAPQAG